MTITIKLEKVPTEIIELHDQLVREGINSCTLEDYVLDELLDDPASWRDDATVSIDLDIP